MAAPSITITSDKTALKIGETATVTFTFSAPPVGFVASDVTVTSGTLSNFASTGDPSVYKAVFTPTHGFSGAAGVSVAADTYSDTGGNLGLGGGESGDRHRHAGADGVDLLVARDGPCR